MGGVVSGFIIGYLYWFILKTEGPKLSERIVLPVIIGVTAISGYFFLQEKQVSPQAREEALLEIKNFNHKDGEKFLSRYNEFVELQDKAVALFDDTTLTAEDFKRTAKEVSYPSWDKANALLIAMNRMDVSENDHQKVKLLTKYVELRKEELHLREEIKTDPQGDKMKKLGEVIDTINITMDEFKKLQSPG